MTILNTIINLTLIVILSIYIYHMLRDKNNEVAKISFKKLNDLAQIPYSADSASAGYDLYAATDYELVIDPHSTVLVGTGLAMELPEGTFGALYSRSGLASKRGIRVATGTSVIDSSYRGEIKVPLHNDTNTAVVIEAGERIAQLVLTPYFPMAFEEVGKLSTTSRSDGGFGHSGRA